MQSTAALSCGRNGVGSSKALSLLPCFPIAGLCWFAEMENQMRLPCLFVALLGAVAATTPIAAQEPKPKLIVAISIDQFSADLFAEYRAQVTGGLKRLQTGVVFPSGYQSHAATETCPGHATILTGSRPARTGIVANEWFDPASKRTGKDGKTDYKVYCAEDETQPGTNSSAYTVSSMHLNVPTLGDRLKALSPQTRVVAVSGKDRAAVMMGGHNTDQSWWWDGKAFVTFKGVTAPAPTAVARVNALATAAIAKPRPLKLSAQCAGHSVVVPIGAGKTVGTLLPRTPGDARALRATPDFDQLTLDLAQSIAADLKLGKGASTDVLAISLSATDYTGHTFGTSGAEMCTQVFALDAMLGGLFKQLDALNTRYAVVLTADHGGHDLPERNQAHAAPDAHRVGTSPTLKDIAGALATKYALTGPVLIGDGIFGDVYLDRSVPIEKRAAVIADAQAALMRHPDVETVITRAALLAQPKPSGPPENWSLIDRAAASFNPARSGDLLVFLKPRVTPIPNPTIGYVATHGSIWDYDRRVPILFWWPGIKGFEQPLGVETVDIMPTLASLIGLDVPKAEIDGRCLDLQPGQESNCR
jgi:predicted AlkP superfamily pyrophosphatase or phosphodiesterase